MYELEISFPSIIPSKGNRITGSREVAPMGIASDTHNIIMRIAIAAVKVTLGEPGFKSINKHIKVKITTPKMIKN